MESMESSAGMSVMWCGYAGDCQCMVLNRSCTHWAGDWFCGSCQARNCRDRYFCWLAALRFIWIHLIIFDSFSTIEHPAFPVHVAVSIHMIRQRGFIRGRVRDLFPDKPKIKHIEPTWHQGWRCKPPSPITCPGTVKAWIGQNCLGPPLWRNY